MNDNAPLICLITPGHIASSPRVVKEADALVGAGYRVHVVAGKNHPPTEPLDAAILATAKWGCTRVNHRAGIGALARNVSRKISQRLIEYSPFAGVDTAARAAHPGVVKQAAVAAGLSADLYIGHCLAGLPAAAFAAQERNVAYGFDAEDFHDAETEPDSSGASARLVPRVLQSRLLPGCSHLTAASPLIAAKYEETYGVKPTPVLNVFPRADGPATPVGTAPVSSNRPARIYWFSQTTGPGRGLEAITEALGRMKTPAELHLRGHVDRAYAKKLRMTGARNGMTLGIHFLDRGPPAEMARLAAEYDLGLSTEETQPLNRDLCLTNKIFVYLLAGIPQLLSHTSAQAALAPELGNAAMLLDILQPGKVAAALDEFFSHPTVVSAARAAAYRLATERYCWDLEKFTFLKSVGKVAPLR